MYKLQQFLLLATMTLMLAGCGDSGVSSGGARLDTSSDSAMEASIEAMTKDMSNSEKQELAKALAGIMMMRGFSLVGEDLSEEEIHARVMEGLDGLTASEIVAKAEEVKAELQSRQ